MRINSILAAVLLLLTLCAQAYAGAPLVSIEGTGGVGVNPVAWITSSSNDTQVLDKYFQKPTIAYWYGHFTDIDADVMSFGLNFAVTDRIELSYGQQIVSPEGADSLNVHSFGAKLNIIPENAFEQPWLPAITGGLIYRSNDDIRDDVLFQGSEDSGVEYYLAATKIITQTPRPLILNLGGAYTDAIQRGVFGFEDDEEDTIFFADAAVACLAKPAGRFLQNIVAGYEYRQGAEHDNFLDDKDIHDVFADFVINDNLIIAFWYMWTGDENDNDELGLGDAVGFMIDYDF